MTAGATLHIEEGAQTNLRLRHERITLNRIDSLERFESFSE